MDTPNANPTRRPSGAAVPGAHPRPKKYPAQLVVMTSDDLAHYVEREAATDEVSKSEKARDYLLAGIEALDGVTDVHAALEDAE